MVAGNKRFADDPRLLNNEMGPEVLVMMPAKAPAFAGGVFCPVRSAAADEGFPPASLGPNEFLPINDGAPPFEATNKSIPKKSELSGSLRSSDAEKKMVFWVVKVLMLV